MTPINEYLPDNTDMPDPADTPKWDWPRREAVSRWIVTAEGRLLPEMARRALAPFFSRSGEARRTGAARARLDQAVLAYAFSGTTSTATDAQKDLVRKAVPGLTL